MILATRVVVPCSSAGAIEDFTSAIEIEPHYPDGWKRRAQAKGGMRNYAEALNDFKQCITLARKDPKTRADCYLECGAVYQKQRDYRKATAELHVGTLSLLLFTSVICSNGS